MFRTIKNRVRSYVLVAVGLAILTGAANSAYAQQYLQPDERASKEFRSTEQRAKSGDSEAQRLLAAMYFRGEGVEPSTTEGEYWLKRAAENGNHEAEFAFGAYNGYKKEYAEANRWCLKAAQAGLAKAQLYLSYLYYEGLGVSRDSTQGFLWSHKAAEQGDATAMTNVALSYEMGEGVSNDPEQAMKWYMKAAELGSAKAEFGIGTLYARGIGIDKDLAKASEWYVLSSRHGYARASFNLAWMTLTGTGVKKDLDAGLEYLSLAVERATTEGRADEKLIPLLAALYVSPEIPKERQDPDTARFLLRPLAEEGNANAILRLGQVEALAGNHVEAVKWFSKGVDNDDVLSVLALATHYRDGKGVTRSEAKAAELYLRAIKLDEGALTLNDTSYFFATVSDAKLKNPELALKLALRAVALDGERAEYLDTLAEAYYCNKDFAQAIAVEERALKLAPDNEVMRKALARFRAAQQSSIP